MTSEPTHLLLWHISAVKLPAPVTEYRFHAERRWRFDLAWPDQWLAVEVDGGVHTNGRHVRGSGFEADLEKMNEAVCAGWTVLRVTPAHIEKGEALRWIERLIGPVEQKRAIS